MLEAHSRRGRQGWLVEGKEGWGRGGWPLTLKLSTRALSQAKRHDCGCDWECDVAGRGVVREKKGAGG